MKARMNSNAKGVAIDITELDVDRDRLLGALDECRQGRCGCPTDQYDKVERVEFDASAAGGLRINIDARDGETLDTAELEKCLAWTADNVRTEE